jgi:transposase InsO family protein
MGQSTPDDFMEKEQQRRLALLGPTIDLSQQIPSECKRIRQRARLVEVSPQYFLQWHQAYRSQGEEGLCPDEWKTLPESLFIQGSQQAQLLGEPLDLIIPDEALLAHQAQTLGWTLQRYREWWRRYRHGGLIALVPGHNPNRHKRRTVHALPPRDFGLLNEQDVALMLYRREQLGECAEQDHLTQQEWRTLSQRTDLSISTLRRYHQNYRTYGMPGLAPRVRSDYGQFHQLSERMVEIIRSIRLTHRGWKVRTVFEMACEKAHQLEEIAPTLWQVRTICDHLPKDVVALADGRESDFRNAFRFTHPLSIPKTKVIWQVDHKEPLDIVIVDHRSERYRSPTGATRPFVTHVIDYHTRLLLNATFSYDKPDRFTVGEALRGALLTSDTKPYGGIPDEIWVDRGGELISQYVRQLCQILGITLYIGRPRHAELHGCIERLHQTFDQRFYATLPGYLLPQHGAYDRPITPELTMDEVVQRFWTYVDRYHHEEHSELHTSPLEAWNEATFTLPVDERVLDMLLLEPVWGKVGKRGIRYANHYYTHPALSLYEGQTLLFRSPSHYTAPDTIEVFDGGSWLCEAKRETGSDGPALTRDEVAQAQQAQRQHARSMITQAQHVMQSLDDSLPGTTTLPSSKKRQKPAKPPSQSQASRTQDFFDLLILQKKANQDTEPSS